MRLAVLGQGSIGRRHAQTLVELGHDVVAFDPDPRGSPVPGVVAADTEADALAQAQAAVVASPTSEHAAQAWRALEAGLHVLVEKPLAMTASEAAALATGATQRGLTVGVAMNLRFHPGPLTVRELVSSGSVGRVLRVSCWFGSWLPSWRPDVDYRQTYSARADLGGGVLLDAIHELDYLVWGFGRVTEVTATLRHLSDLELDNVEDVAALELELAAGGLATVTLDYLDRAYHRGCRVVGSEGTLAWSWNDERAVLHRPDGGHEEYPAPSGVTSTYRAEIEDFISAVAAGGVPAATADEAAYVLAVVEAARRSAAHGRRVVVDAPEVTVPARESR